MYTPQRKQEVKERYWFLKQRGLCTGCGRERAFNGRVLCPSCMERRAEDDAHRDREYLARKAKERADRLRAAGICRDCGKRPVREGRTRCPECLRKNCLRTKQANARKRIRKPDGLCWRRGCENPVIPGKKTCAAHYPEMARRAEIMRTHCDNTSHIWRLFTGAELARIRRYKQCEIGGTQ